MYLKKGDKVRVITGQDRGKEGKVLAIFKAKNKVIVEGINKIKKHNKPQGQNAGSITEKEAPINASNVMIIDDKTKKPTRIGHTINKDKKIRVTKKSNANLD